MEEPIFKLSAGKKASFQRDGYLVLPKFLSPQTTSNLLKRAHQLLEEFSLEGHPLTRFVASEDQGRKHVGDEYFLNSSDKISFFFEDGAFDESGRLTLPKEKAINKIGHALHELDPVFRKATLENDDIKSLARDLCVHRDPRVLQSMCILKQPSIGGTVPIHDDSTFLYTSPPSALGFWFALEPCRLKPTANGVLSFLPGSHRRNRISRRFVRSSDGRSASFEPVPGVEPVDIDWSKEDGWREEECEPGTLVVIDGLVIHKSEHNHSDRSRFAYTFHMIEGDAEYDAKNWLQPTPNMPFSKLFAEPIR